MIKTLLAPYLGWIYGAAALAALACGYLVYDAIYDRGYEAASAIYEQQALDRKAANDAAIAKATETLNASVAKLIIEKERLVADVERLSAEAAADPDGATGGIKSGSVQRLNSVR